MKPASTFGRRPLSPWLQKPKGKQTFSGVACSGDFGFVSKSGKLLCSVSHMHALFALCLKGTKSAELLWGLHQKDAGTVRNNRAVKQVDQSLLGISPSLGGVQRLEISISGNPCFPLWGRVDKWNWDPPPPKYSLVGGEHGIANSDNSPAVTLA